MFDSVSILPENRPLLEKNINEGEITFDTLTNNSTCIIHKNKIILSNLLNQ